MAKYIPEVTIENETYLLKDSEARESIERMDEIDKVLDDRTNELYGYVNYGYNVNKTIAATSSYKYSITRNKTIYTIDGVNTSSYSGRIKICNNMERAVTSAAVDAFTDGLTLIPGHKYKVCSKRISGSYSDTVGANTVPVSVYRQGEHSSVGEAIILDGEYSRVFTAEDNIEYMICLYVYNTTTIATNFVFSVTLKDLSVESAADCPVTKAPVATNEIEADYNVIHFTDGADNMPMTVKVVTGYEQDFNGYDYPWLPSNGKNVFPNEWNDTGTSEAAWRSLSFPVDLNTNENYTFSNFDGVHKEYICAYDANDTFLGRTTGGARTTQTVNKNSFTSDVPSSGADPDTIDHLRIHMYDWSGVTKEDLIALNIQCEIGNTATAYEPYSNTCPITGCDEVTIRRYQDTEKTYDTFIEGKYINETGGISSQASWKYVAEYTEVYSDTDYVLSVAFPTIVSSAAGATLAYYDEKKQFIIRDVVIPIDSATGTKSGDFHTPKNAKYIRFSVQTSGTDVSVNGKVYNVYSIDLYDATGMVYGGEITIHKDGSASIVQTWWKHVFDGTETIAINGEGATAFARYNLPSSYPKPYTTTHADRNAATKSSHNRIGTVNTSTTSFSQGIWYNSSYLYIGTRTRDIVNGQTAEEFKAYLAEQYANGTPVTVIYKCVPTDPVYISASQIRTLLKSTYVACPECNSMSVEYPSDTKTYIASKNDTVKGIAATLETFVAKENHVIGDVFICGDKLYHATTAIATGEVIAEGTNVATTLTIGETEVPLNLANYIRSIALSVTDIGADVSYLNTKVIDPDEAMSKNMYIQNGTLTYSGRTVTVKDGAINFTCPSTSGANYRSIWITGTEFAGGSENLSNSVPPVGNVVSVSNLTTADAVRVHYDKISGTGYCYIAIAYCTVDGTTVTLVGSKQSFTSNNETDYIVNLNIPANATHYAIQVYQTSPAVCEYNAYLKFIKTQECSSATGVSF